MENIINRNDVNLFLVNTGSLAIQFLENYLETSSSSTKLSLLVAKNVLDVGRRFLTYKSNMNNVRGGTVRKLAYLIFPGFLGNSHPVSQISTGIVTASMAGYTISKIKAGLSTPFSLKSLTGYGILLANLAAQIYAYRGNAPAETLTQHVSRLDVSKNSILNGDGAWKLFGHYDRNCRKIPAASSCREVCKVIGQKFRELAKSLHPDKNPDHLAHKAMENLNKIKSVLSRHFEC